MTRKMKKNWFEEMKIEIVMKAEKVNRERALEIIRERTAKPEEGDTDGTEFEVIPDVGHGDDTLTAEEFFGEGMK